tara:strand:- start:6398 stop:7648 length:1251 start_codon:yes stop_codon:yes gene_type:complete
MHKYITFEYDIGGWNNIRLALENVIIFALLLKRTLVLPPTMHLYLLNSRRSRLQDYIRESFFNHPDLRVISITDYINELSKSGSGSGSESGSGSGSDIRQEGINVPLPENRIITSMLTGDLYNYWGNQIHPIFLWMRKVGYQLKYNLDTFFVFDSNNAVNWNHPRIQDFKQGLELQKNKVLIIGDWLNQYPILHFMGDGDGRLISYHTSKIYIESFEQHKFVRRFLRDHFTYHDTIYKWANVIINKLNDLCGSQWGWGSTWHSCHIRRGDFQFTETRLSCDDLSRVFLLNIPVGDLLYIATDEKDRSFFKPLSAYYRLYFFNDLLDKEVIERENINTNWIGMIEQIVASRGECFYGTFLSTFTHYILRLRGYHSEDCYAKSWYTNLDIMNYLHENQERKAICSWQHEHSDVWKGID